MKPANTKQMLLKYFNAYQLSIMYDTNKTTNYYLDIIVDKACPEIIQKINKLSINDDVYDYENSDISTMKIQENTEDIKIYFNESKIAEKVFNTIKKSFTSNGFNINHTVFDDTTCINIRIENKCDYIELVSEIFNIIIEGSKL